MTWRSTSWAGERPPDIIKIRLDTPEAERAL